MKVHHTEMAECTCCIAALIEPLATFQLAVTEPQEGDEGMIAYIGARDAIHGVVLSLIQAAIEQEREANAILAEQKDFVVVDSYDRGWNSCAEVIAKGIRARSTPSVVGAEK